MILAPFATTKSLVFQIQTPLFSEFSLLFVMEVFDVLALAGEAI